MVTNNTDKVSVFEIMSMAHFCARGRPIPKHRMPFLRRLARPNPVLRSLISRSYASGRDYGTVEEFTRRWATFFDKEAYDQFELLRGLNNCFSYDIVPPVPVLEAALRASRRLGDFATAVRVFGGIREKVENKMQYETYMEHLRDLKEELGVPTPEELGRE